MGVIGLWRLIDAAGKPVPLETLEGKVLAVDVSIWIHQVLQGYQDRRGNSLPNAHLIGLFNRISKLLYYKIKPVFVFDGGVPVLKKNTIASRRKQKSAAATKAQKLKNDLINNLVKHTAVKNVLDKKEDANSSEQSTNILNCFSSTKSDMFALPEMPSTSQIHQNEIGENYESDYESENELSPRKQSKWIGNIHHVDVDSNEFRDLPADVRYDILTDLKETRKQNSWGRLHEMPEKSQDFSNFQMRRLLKRRLVQESLEAAEQEMGGKTLTIEELEKLMNEQGIATNKSDTVYRIASDNVTRVIYINDKNGLKDMQMPLESTSEVNEEIEIKKNNEPVPSTSENKKIPVSEDMNEYDIDNDWESESEFMEIRQIPKDIQNSLMNPALIRMLEYNNLPQSQILELIEEAKKTQGKARKKSNRSNEGINRKRNKKNIDLLSSSSDSDDFVEAPKLRRKKNVRTAEVVSDIFVADSPIINNNFLNNEQTEKEEKISVSEISDLETDDFIEIEDLPLPVVDNIPRTQGLEITVNLDKKMEEDIFADVFKVSSDSDTVQPEVTGVRKTEEQLNKNIEILETSENSKIQKSTVHKFKDIMVEKTNKGKSDYMTGEEKQMLCITIQNSVEAVSDTADNPEIENVDSTDVKETHFAKTSQVNETDSTTYSVNLSQTQEEKVSKQDSIVLPTDEKELLSLKTKLEDEQIQITGDIGKLERQAIDVTDQIRMEAQDLLQLFGIPYITAPMEAEAQCAYLETIKLTDGTITDDSDIWLFGGQCVYKNFFDNNKRVLQFLLRDIQYHYKLSRREMIQLALLVGSDYTKGVDGIGPVTALEILAAFPSEGDDLLRGLFNFLSWINVGKLTSSAKVGLGLRNKLRNIKIDKGFPSQAVAQAYLFPKVDESKEKFTWGKPNLTLLLDYVKKKFGWSKTKFEEIINPIMKKQLETKNQKSLEAYFKMYTVPKSIEVNMSKRVQLAVKKLGYDNLEDLNKTKNKEEKVDEKNSKRVGKQKMNEPSNISDEIEKGSSIVTQQTKNVDEYIPQRELNKANALNNKLKAIEIYRKSKIGLGRTKKIKKRACMVVNEAHLSESSSSS